MKAIILSIFSVFPVLLWAQHNDTYQKNIEKTISHSEYISTFSDLGKMKDVRIEGKLIPIDEYDTSLDREMRVENVESSSVDTRTDIVIQGTLITAEDFSPSMGKQYQINHESNQTESTVHDVYIEGKLYPVAIED